MKPALDSRTLARKPTQQRAKDRTTIVLQEAEALLLETGLSGFSIPTLAGRLDFPRATIYKFFPTPYALLNELAERHLAALEAKLSHQAIALRNLKNWEDGVSGMVRAAARYYQSHPVAYSLLLGPPISDSSHRAFEYTISRLGALTRSYLVDHGIRVPPGPPDIPALAVEFGTASFRMSYFLHGRITSPYIEAAVDVMLAFLNKRLDLSDT